MGVCDDVPDFVDGLGYTCPVWQGDNCFANGWIGIYTQRQLEDVQINCAGACEVCSYCQDQHSFSDFQGYSCRNWLGLDCDSYLGEYDTRELALVFRNCPSACGIC